MPYEPARSSAAPRPHRRQLPVLALLLLASACTTVTYESFRPVQNRNVDIAYVATGADFSQYRRLLIEDMGIFYPGSGAPSEADLERVRDAFRSAFTAEISNYEIVERPAADVLKVRASLVDLRYAAPAERPDISADINAILETGKLTFVIEMRDSKSDRVLLRAADTDKAPQIDLPEDGSADSAEVQAAAAHWARLLRNFLDTNLR
ncbi:MAG: hypothetical protein BMS9Abin32_482 [Gammaproteobacteria bacterium]|nr:MAG: hypothetical protein BMS9Abin32_482 [Gammaproteobacteria bacterium]